MRKKILVFILVLAMLLPCVFMFAACNNKDKASLDFSLTGGSKPEYESLFSSEDQSLINAALAENATEEQKNQAAMALFNTANYSRKNTPVSLMLQNSEIGIPLAEIPLHGFNLRSGDKWYYQLVAEAHADDEFVTTLMSMIAGLVKIAYSKGDGNYYYSEALGTSANPNCRVETFPYATFDLIKDFTRYNAEEFKEELHYIDSFHEVINMEFCAEILKDVVITYEDAGYYHVEFSVDMDADPELLSRWYAMVKADVEVSGQTINKYNYYDAVLEVWDNGYAKCFKSRSSRDAGIASGSPTDEFTFLWVEDEIMELLHEDQSIHFSSGLETVDDFIEYYSDPELVSAQLSKNVIIVIVVLVLVGVLIIGAIVALITVIVLLKKGKLPKLAAWLDACKQKRLAKKASKGTEKDAEPDNENDVKPDEEVELDNESVKSDEDSELDNESVKSEEDVESDNEDVKSEEEEGAVPEQDND